MVKAFRSTLEEVVQADVILHVIDPVHPACFEHIDTVYDILAEFDAYKKPIITVINKIDLVKDEETLGKLLEKVPNPVKISALKRKSFGALLSKVQKVLAY